MVSATLRFLRAPRTALLVLVFQAIYAACAVWLPIRFSSPAFLGSVVLLFLSTLVCTLDRTRATLALWRGGNRGGYPLERRDGVSVRSFLHAQGYCDNGRILFRYRFACWGGWILHVGVLALILGIFVQQTLHDGGAFELTEGETTTLSQTGAVFGRQSGVLASDTPPPVAVTLLAFDPYYHQSGYAPDRASRIAIDGKERFVDRAKGVTASGVTIFQAIPTSLSVNLEITSMGVRSIHLRRESDRRAAADIKDPAGQCMRVVATTERGIDDIAGTGAIEVRLDSRNPSVVLEQNQWFTFGSERARLVSVARWGGFTYSRSPGVPLVFAGFFLILLGSALLVFPAGAARIVDDESVAAWIHMKRGASVLAQDWAAWREPDPSADTASPLLHPVHDY